MLASLLVGLSGVRTHGQSNQNDTGQTKTSKHVYDIDGKRLRLDEKYIAERTLKDGRIMAYRKNKREIAALVKALKEDGVTDEKLLDPKNWMKSICWQSASLGCRGGCRKPYTCRPLSGSPDKTANPELQTSTLNYCRCD